MSICDKLPMKKVLLSYNKFILGVNKKPTTAAVRGELGCFPLLITMLPQAAKFWLKLCTHDSLDLVNLAYRESLQMANTSWATHIQSLWTKSGLSNL